MQAACKEQAHPSRVCLQGLLQAFRLPQELNLQQPRHRVYAFLRGWWLHNRVCQLTRKLAKATPLQAWCHRRRQRRDLARVQQAIDQTQTGPEPAAQLLQLRRQKAATLRRLGQHEDAADCLAAALCEAAARPRLQPPLKLWCLLMKMMHEQRRPFEMARAAAVWLHHAHVAGKENFPGPESFSGNIASASWYFAQALEACGHFEAAAWFYFRSAHLCDAPLFTLASGASRQDRRQNGRSAMYLAALARCAQGQQQFAAASTITRRCLAARQHSRADLLEAPHLHLRLQLSGAYLCAHNPAGAVLQLHKADCAVRTLEQDRRLQHWEGVGSQHSVPVALLHYHQACTASTDVGARPAERTPVELLTGALHRLQARLPAGDLRVLRVQSHLAMQMHRTEASPASLERVRRAAQAWSAPHVPTQDECSHVPHDLLARPMVRMVLGQEMSRIRAYCQALPWVAAACSELAHLSTTCQADVEQQHNDAMKMLVTILSHVTRERHM